MSPRSSNDIPPLRSAGSARLLHGRRHDRRDGGLTLDPNPASFHPPRLTWSSPPIAWTSLQWATYSSQQNGEIKSAGSFRDQAYIIVGSLILTGLLLALLALVLENTVGTQFLYVAGAGLLERCQRGDPGWFGPLAEHHRDGTCQQRGG